MGARCYDCGEKFGRCYEHAGNCPDDCSFGSHDCPGDPWGDCSDNDLVTEVAAVPVVALDMEW